MVAIGATPQGVAWEAQGCFAQGSSHAALPHTAEANPRTLKPAPWPAGGRVPRVRRQVGFLLPLLLLRGVYPCNAASQ